MLAWSLLQFALYSTVLTLTTQQLSDLKHSCIVSPLLQTYEVLILFAVYYLYVYARPYKATFVNILELALLAYLGLFLILAKDFQQQAATSTQLDATSVDKIACIYLYAYIILYVGNMCVGHAVC